MSRVAGRREVGFCRQCGKEMIVKLYNRTYTYCSKKCYWAASVGSTRHHRRPKQENTCIVCGKMFAVGGRGNPPKKQRACSIACQRAGRYRHGATAREMSTVERAYLAGIVDGEGSIILYESRGAVALRIIVANTDHRLIEWVRNVTAVGQDTGAHKATERHKASYYWACNSDAAYSVLTQIRPYLVVKTAQADLAMETKERLQIPALKADRVWQMETRDQMRLLNKRGPKLTAGS